MTGKTTGGAGIPTTREEGPRPVLSTVRIAAKYAANDAKINWAAATALREIRDIVRTDWPGWTVPAANLELVSVSLEVMPGHAVMLFRGTPARIPVKRRRRR